MGVGSCLVVGLVHLIGSSGGKGGNPQEKETGEMKQASNAIAICCFAAMLVVLTPVPPVAGQVAGIGTTEHRLGGRAVVVPAWPTGAAQDLC